jgi:sugar phosphate isomerase/epimerase
VELVIRGDGVWPGHVDPQRLADDPAYAAELSAVITAAGLPLWSAGCEMAADLAVDEELRRHRVLMPWLAQLGVRVLTIFVYDHDHPRRWPALDAIAQGCGLVLAAETHLGTALAQPEEAIRVAEERNLRITLDASHYVGQGFTRADWADLESWIVAVQVRHCRVGELQEPSTDITVLSSSFGQLIPPTYMGPVVCEQIANPTDPDWTEQLRYARLALLSRQS